MSAKDKDIWVQAFGKVYVEVFETPIHQLESLVTELQAIYDRTHGLAPKHNFRFSSEVNDAELNDQVPGF